MSRIRVALILVVLTLLLAACGPISLAPGLRLGGAEVATPGSWSGVEIPEVVQLRTEGSLLPRVVNIWAASDADHIYVAGDANSGWVQRALANPNVYLRLDDDVYALRANRIDDTAAQLRATKIFMGKYREGMLELYGKEPVPEEMAGATVLFSLDPR